MKARDGPEIPPAPLVTAPPEMAPLVTRHEAPVSRSKLMTKRTPGRQAKAVKKPASKVTKKPLATPGYFFRKNGAGWDLRRDIYVTSNDGEKKRKQPYVAHLSREAFGDLKRKHRGTALERAIAEWIEDHDR